MGTDGLGSPKPGALKAAFGPLSAAEQRRLGRLAGALYLAGGAFSFPAGFALDPQPEPAAFLLVVVGMLTGVAALLAPWERMSPVWLHVLLVLGTIQVALAVDLFSDDFSFYYVTVAAYAA